MTDADQTAKVRSANTFASLFLGNAGSRDRGECRVFGTLLGVLFSPDNSGKRYLETS